MKLHQLRAQWTGEPFLKESSDGVNAVGSAGDSCKLKTPDETPVTPSKAKTFDSKQVEQAVCGCSILSPTCGGAANGGVYLFLRARQFRSLW